MAGYVTVLGCSRGQIRAYRSLQAAVHQAWLGGTSVACFLVALTVLYFHPLLALAPLALAVMLMTVAVRRGNRHIAHAREIARQEQAAEAAALAGRAPARGEYRGETVWRPLGRTAMLFAAAVVALFLYTFAMIGPGAGAALLAVYPGLLAAIGFSAAGLFLLALLAFGPHPRRVVWDGDGLEVTYATGLRRRFHWDDLTGLSVGPRFADVTAGRRSWRVLSSGDGFADLAAALKVQVWGRV